MVAAGGRVRIASRGSELALWQTDFVRGALAAIDPALPVEVQVIRTTGDKILDVPLAKIGDRGLFTKEIDEALLAGVADLAVHSLKDVPTRLPDGLVIAAVTEREDPRDVLICRAGAEADLRSLPPGSRVGTSSLRRRAQLRTLRPDLEVLDLRGNLNTRMARLDDGGYEAIILAAAGVIRLGWTFRISEWLEPEHWLPAVGQGALAVITREDDPTLRGLLVPLHDPATAVAVTAERALLRSLEGGCQVPIAAFGVLRGDRLHLDALVSNLDGSRRLRHQAEGAPEGAAGLGTGLADRLIAEGANEILAEVRAEHEAPGVPAP